MKIVKLKSLKNINVNINKIKYVDESLKDSFFINNLIKYIKSKYIKITRINVSYNYIEIVITKSNISEVEFLDFDKFYIDNENLYIFNFYDKNGKFIPNVKNVFIRKEKLKILLNE